MIVLLAKYYAKPGTGGVTTIVGVSVGEGGVGVWVADGGRVGGGKGSR